MSKSHQDKSSRPMTVFDYSSVLEKAEAQYKSGVLTRDQFLRIQASCEQKIQEYPK